MSKYLCETVLSLLCFIIFRSLVSLDSLFVNYLFTNRHQAAMLQHKYCKNRNFGA